MKRELFWAVHNMVAHPVMGILQCSSKVALLLGYERTSRILDKAGEMIHEATVPHG